MSVPRAGKAKVRVWRLGPNGQPIGEPYVWTGVLMPPGKPPPCSPAERRAENRRKAAMVREARRARHRDRMVRRGEGMR